MSSLTQEHSMPQHEIPPQTSESVAAARAIQRRIAGGFDPDDDGPLSVPPIAVVAITNEGIPLEQRIECGEAVTALVARFGLPCVQRSLRIVEALQR